MYKTLVIGFAGLMAGCQAYAEAPRGPETSSEVGSVSDAAVAKDARITAIEMGLSDLKDRGKPDAEKWSIEERMAEHGVPGAGVAIIENGEIIWAQGYGVLSARSDELVDKQTVFSAGSISKLINAAVILRLAQDGRLDLDEDVNTYLTSWKAPDNEFTRARKVTLRMLLSHTSGFSQHGFPDFEPDEELPTVLQTLNGEPPAKHDAVELLFEPGSKMKYSGGGVTVSQLVVEDVTGVPYVEAAQKYVFAPLGMTCSTFANPLPAEHGNVAKAHDRKGRPRALPRGYESMPEMAASGLWVSAEDMAIFVRALLLDDEFLSDELRTDMLTRVPLSWHGLGPRLNGSGEKLVFHHGGANNSYQAWVEGHPAQGDGIVVLTNGAGGRLLAYEIRVAAENAFGWSIHFPDDLDEPEF